MGVIEITSEEYVKSLKKAIEVNEHKVSTIDLLLDLKLIPISTAVIERNKLYVEIDELEEEIQKYETKEKENE